MQPEPMMEGQRGGRGEKKASRQSGSQRTGEGYQGDLPAVEGANGLQGKPEHGALHPECGDAPAHPAGIGVRRFVNDKPGQQAYEMNHKPESDFGEIQVGQNEAQKTACGRHQKHCGQGHPAGADYCPQHVPEREIPDSDLRQG
ncbi:MAG: hypothetical protein JWQ56_3207 [Pseudarthrobacter sp.]|nr:hypothetical protein [Pseudarthrobacter sp.]